MKKFILLFLSIWVISSQAPAAVEEYFYLTVTKADGQEKSYELKNLKISFSPTEMNFNENGKSEAVSLAKLANAKMRFTELPTSILDVISNETVVVNNGDCLNISSAEKTTLYVYSTDGTLKMSKRVEEGETTIDISRFEKGVYVVKIGNKAIKIQKR